MATDVAEKTIPEPEANSLAEWAFYIGLALAVIPAVASVFTKDMATARAAVFVAGLVITIIASIVLWMPHVFTLMCRELSAFFLSPIAYMVLIGMCLIAAWNFYYMAFQLADTRIQISEDQNPIFQFLGANIWLLFALLVVPGIVTMRLFSEERRSGTIEMLLTAPVSDIEVVIGKFVASVVFYMFLWIPWAVYLVVLYQQVEFDHLKIVAAYLCLLVLGCPFLAGGLFFSSLTKNQIVSFILTFAMMVLFLAIVVGVGFAQSSGVGQNVQDALRYLSFWSHLYEFGQGKVDLRIVVLHMSIAVVFLFGAVVSVKGQRAK